MNSMLRLMIFIVLCTTLPVEARPKVGLVLSGGGARGAAHIGVLKYLEEQQIPVDVIAGTSMGAIVGGLYASGYSADEIAVIVREMDWSEKLTDNVPRQERSVQRKRMEDLFSISGSPGFSEGKIKLPSGVIQGQNIILEFRRITHHVAHITDFSKLPIPFSALATDIGTGEMVLLDHGDLALAMRASMGVPAVFAPTDIDGLKLVDGGISNNLPVDIARQMGADLLIVVDISSPLRTTVDINNLLSVTDQLTRILTRSNTSRQLDTLTAKDILIIPELGDLSAMDFGKASEAIASGYEAASNFMLSLSTLKVDGSQIQKPNKPQVNPQEIGKVSLSNNSGLNDEVINNIVDVSSGDTLDLAQLENDLNRVHGLGNFQLVDYGLTHHDDGVDLDLIASAKDWGPGYLHFGLNVESEFENDARGLVLLGYTREEMTDTGAEWTSMIGLGDERLIQTIWYQPLSYRRNWYFFSLAGFSDEPISVFDGDQKTAEYRIQKMRGYVGIGREFGSSAVVQIGTNRISGDVALSTGDPMLTNSEFEDGNIEVTYLYDTRDDIDFPSRGTSIGLRWRSSLQTLGAAENYQQWTANVGHHFSWGSHNIGLGMQLGGTNGLNNVGSVFRLGGYGQLTGLRPDQLAGNYKAIFSAIYRRRYDGIPAVDGFIGSILEYGGAWEHRDDISTSNALLSAGAFVGADTPIGTMQVGFALTDEGDRTFFARIGRLF